MSVPASSAPADLDEFRLLYERALPEVFGYLRRRCGADDAAEDLTADVFLAGAREHARGGSVTIPWLITVARNKLIDHWRRAGREQRKLTVLAGEASDDDLPPWDREPDVAEIRRILGELTPAHRSALVLRYLDGLSVPEAAALLDRSVHATESLLVRARGAFRDRYVTEVLDV